jgi:uncharacterized protein YjiS (DUF1127 family)
MTIAKNCSEAVHAPVSAARAVGGENKAAWYRRWFAAARAIYIRDRERRELLTLDDRTLADIGLTRCDVLAEAEKPFWKI